MDKIVSLVSVENNVVTTEEVNLESPWQPALTQTDVDVLFKKEMTNTKEKKLSGTTSSTYPAEIEAILNDIEGEKTSEAAVDEEPPKQLTLTEATAKISELNEKRQKDCIKINTLQNLTTHHKQVIAKLTERITKLEYKVNTGNQNVQNFKDELTLDLFYDCPPTDAPYYQHAPKKVPQHFPGAYKKTGVTNIAAKKTKAKKNTKKKLNVLKTGLPAENSDVEMETEETSVPTELSSEKQEVVARNKESVNSSQQNPPPKDERPATMSRYLERLANLQLAKQNRKMNKDLPDKPDVMLSEYSKDRPDLVAAPSPPLQITPQVKDRVLGVGKKIEWCLRKRDEISTQTVQHCGTFYTQEPGYRVQLKTQIDRLHGDMYFSMRLMQGLYDDHVKWPCQQKFIISLSPKMKLKQPVKWYVPSNYCWSTTLSRPSARKDAVVSEWAGPFNISQFLTAKQIVLDVSLA